MFYFEKMEVNDFRNDVLLAEACRPDVDRFCKHVEPGQAAGICHTGWLYGEVLYKIISNRHKPQ